MFCTTVIPTIGRASLARAVHSVLDQTCPAPFEVIVVNDSPQPLTVAWPPASAVRVITTGGQGRSRARNAGAALAQGRYLNFLDDDDWLLPGALAQWLALSQASDAAWLYGASQLTDSAGRVLFQFQHDLAGNCLVPAMTGEWIPLQSSAIQAAAFHTLGGFTPTLDISEDKDLLVRVCRRYAVAGVAAPVAGILRGQWATSSDYSTVSSATQRSREVILNLPGTLAHMQASARTPYWRGKLTRAYATSLIWNLRQRQPARALRRAAAAAWCTATAGHNLLRPTYWRAVTHGHLTPGFVPPAA